MYHILVINPGSVSTKVAWYREEERIFQRGVEHSMEELGRFKNIADQLEMRRNCVQRILKEEKVDMESLSAIVARGGLLPHFKGGGYLVDANMLKAFRQGLASPHAANLACIIAYELAEPLGIPAYIYDAVTADELEPVAKLTGLPEYKRQPQCHVLNQKAVARKAASSVGRKYKVYPAEKGEKRMIAKDMRKYVEGSSAIRAMFEEGARLAEKFGKENVYDFSLGNPCVSPPPQVEKAIIDILKEEDSTYIHGYNQSNSGYEDVRAAIAININKKQGTNFESKNIIMTVGAAGGLNVILKTLIDPGDQVVAFAPYFVEYKNYAANYGGNLLAVPADTTTFQPNIKKLEEIMTEKTKAVIINSPNNPTGVIYSRETLEELAGVLTKKEKEYGHDIYIISDEPYRELAYDGNAVPYVTEFYHNTVVVYSWSKSLSLPGERIGYLVIPHEISDFSDTVDAANIANRILGYVNAPTLMQRVAARCLDCSTDLGFYDKNRKVLYEGLIEAGYECIRPQGAFYLFVKVPMDNEKTFIDLAKEYNILLVPGSSFQCPGYVRIAYCVSHETILRALPKFKALMEEIKGGKL